MAGDPGPAYELLFDAVTQHGGGFETALFSRNTILVVASAPAFPHGVIDPVAALSTLAAEHGVLCHVDACVGSFMLPWLERLGRPIPPWDFRLAGVTSISADLHKYRYAAKGASTIVYRSRSLSRQQFFAYPRWPGGMYAAPTMTGTRSGGSIAAAWAVMRFLGAEGYLRLARIAANAAVQLMAGIRAIAGLFILGSPDMTLFAFGATSCDIYAVGDAMARLGWRLDRQHDPASLHMVVTANHAGVVAEFLADLRAAVAAAPASGPTAGGALYGMLGAAPVDGDGREFLLDFLDRP